MALRRWHGAMERQQQCTREERWSSSEVCRGDCTATAGGHIWWHNEAQSATREERRHACEGAMAVRWRGGSSAQQGSTMW